jgi:hypothetical protein
MKRVDLITTDRVSHLVQVLMSIRISVRITIANRVVHQLGRAIVCTVSVIQQVRVVDLYNRIVGWRNGGCGRGSTCRRRIRRLVSYLLHKLSDQTAAA